MGFAKFVPSPVRKYIRPTLEHLGFVASRTTDIERRLRRFENRACCVVQVGSNDGKQGDPIHRVVMRNPQWSGLFIEPIPYLFSRLKETYNGLNGLQFLNAAIGDQRGRSILWSIKPEARPKLGLPIWYDQLSSFDRSHIIKHFGPEIIPYIIRVEVPCETLAGAIDSAGLGHVDFLHVDAEAYEPQILRQIDFERITPSIVMYEHKHLSTADKLGLKLMFEAKGYAVTEDETDAIAERSE